MPDKASRIFKAIADPTRREIFHVLVVASTALPINQVAANFDVSRQAVTKHIKTLEEAGLLKITSNGRERYCQANLEPLKVVQDWLKFYDTFWDDSIQKLGKYLDSKD